MGPTVVSLSIFPHFLRREGRRRDIIDDAAAMMRRDAALDGFFCAGDVIMVACAVTQSAVHKQTQQQHCIAIISVKQCNLS